MSLQCPGSANLWKGSINTEIFKPLHSYTATSNIGKIMTKLNRLLTVLFVFYYRFFQTHQSTQDS